MAKAKYLLQQKDYQFKTDGRRILAYHSYLIKEKDDEGLRLLKKIADMDIEDFPSNIMQQIRTVMEATINASQRHPEANKKGLATWINHQINDGTKTMKRGSKHNHRSKKTNETWKQPHPLKQESLSKSLFEIQNTI
ncbi:hypothetical protein Goshw_000185, partial [Gossypium schwendimanii]|nr:hypothetical protein [Gossypium schwendimanii]